MSVATLTPPANAVSTLKVYNTLTRAKEPFQTVRPGQVSMYLCGPTVYKPAHIGHMVGPVIFDTIKRYLTYLGYRVTWVVNITDVDDKLINKARELGTSVETLARKMTDDYFDNLRVMGVTVGPGGIDQTPYATAHIAEMQEIITTLIERGYAYPLAGDVYFQCLKDADYGKLSRRSLEDMLAGTRAETKDGKHHPADFALWKASKAGEPAWDSPWGPGRPGWHIECSAMARKILGDTIDIHGGGLDLMFPHHENELAQSESCTGKPFARYWLHNGLMQAAGQAGKVGGQHDKQGDKTSAATTEAPPAPSLTDALSHEQLAQEANKIAGSKGAASVKELFARHSPEAIRFFLLSTHYRSPIQFSDELLTETGRGLEGFYRFFKRVQRISGKSYYEMPYPGTRAAGNASLAEAALANSAATDFYHEVSAIRAKFCDALDDDFNTGAGTAALFDLLRVLNKFGDVEKLESQPTPEKVAIFLTGVAVLRELTAILGVFLQPVSTSGGGDETLLGQLMSLLIEIRANSRKNKDFATADLIRKKLAEFGVALEDRPGGTEWTREMANKN
ncbi:MAG: cysteine--tRNA ligase [Pirellulales bacterium]|nr:cysteine--tRNA ligase [Pirellulales bacterium]